MTFQSENPAIDLVSPLILLKVDRNLLVDDANRMRTIIKTITFEESFEDDSGEKSSSAAATEKISSQPTVTPQFKQLEPLKMVKRDLSKDFLPSSSSTSSADTIINTKFNERSLG